MDQFLFLHYSNYRQCAFSRRCIFLFSDAVASLKLTSPPHISPVTLAACSVIAMSFGIVIYIISVCVCAG